MKRCSEITSQGELKEWLFKTNGSFQVMKSFIAILPVFGMVKDATGRVLTMNGAAEKLLMVKAAERIGLPLTDLAVDPEAIERQERAVFRGKKAAVFSTELRDTQGKVVRYSLLKYTFANDDGELFLASIGVAHSKG